MFAAKITTENNYNVPKFISPALSKYAILSVIPAKHCCLCSLVIVYGTLSAYMQRVAAWRNGGSNSAENDMRTRTAVARRTCSESRRCAKPPVVACKRRECGGESRETSNTCDNGGKICEAVRAEKEVAPGTY